MTSGPAQTVMAIDPGSSKCGLAVVRRENGSLSVRYRTIVPSEELASALETAIQAEPCDLIVVGSGTRSRKAVESVRASLPGKAVLVVDESNTTLKARERYWEHNPRRGWRRLLPATLQMPPEPIDDFAAVVLAERVLAT